MDNLLLEEIIKTEAIVGNLNPHMEATITLTASSVGQIAALKHIDRFSALRLFQPFEKAVEQNYYYIEYVHPTRKNITMRIKTREIPQTV